MNDEQIKISTSEEALDFKSNPLFDTSTGFDETLGFTPLCEF